MCGLPDLEREWMSRWLVLALLIVLLGLEVLGMAWVIGRTE